MKSKRPLDVELTAFNPFETLQGIMSAFHESLDHGDKNIISFYADSDKLMS